MLQPRFKAPKLGTVLPATELEFQPPAGYPMPSQDDVKQFAVLAAQGEAWTQTQRVLTEYQDTTLPSWIKYQYLAGVSFGKGGVQGDPYAPAPTPPHGFVVLVAPAEAADYDLQIIQMGPQVCPSPVPGVDYTLIPAPQHILSGTLDPVPVKA